MILLKKFFVFRKQMYMRFFFKYVPDFCRVPTKTLPLGFFFFFLVLILLLSCIFPCLLVVHFSSRPMMKSNIMSAAIFPPL